MEVYFQSGFFTKQGSEATITKAPVSTLLLNFVEF